MKNPMITLTPSRLGAIAMPTSASTSGFATGAPLFVSDAAGAGFGITRERHIDQGVTAKRYPGNQAWSPPT